MTIKKTSKSKLIEVAYAAFRKYGYHGTSMLDIAQASGLLKGSIYHYFESKKELLMAVLSSKMVHDSLGDMNVAFHDRIEPKDRMKRLMDGINDATFVKDGGCIMGNMSLEISDSMQEVTFLIERFFSNWIEAVAHIYAQKFDENLAHNKAQKVLKELEGAIILSRIYGDSAFLTETKADIISELNI